MTSCLHRNRKRGQMPERNKNSSETDFHPALSMLYWDADGNRRSCVQAGFFAPPLKLVIGDELGAFFASSKEIHEWSGYGIS